MCKTISMASEDSSATHGAPPATSVNSSVRCFLHQRNEARDLYSKATRKVGCLEFSLEATQAALLAAEGETSAAHAMLVDADARVASMVPLNRISFSLTTSLS
jgi:hypothetical protein